MARSAEIDLPQRKGWSCARWDDGEDTLNYDIQMEACVEDYTLIRHNIWAHRGSTYGSGVFMTSARTLTSSNHQMIILLYGYRHPEYWVEIDRAQHVLSLRLNHVDQQLAVYVKG